MSQTTRQYENANSNSTSESSATVIRMMNRSTLGNFNQSNNFAQNIDEKLKDIHKKLEKGYNGYKTNRVNKNEFIVSSFGVIRRFNYEEYKNFIKKTFILEDPKIEKIRKDIYEKNQISKSIIATASSEIVELDKRLNQIQKERKQEEIIFQKSAKDLSKFYSRMQDSVSQFNTRIDSIENSRLSIIAGYQAEFRNEKRFITAEENQMIRDKQMRDVMEKGFSSMNTSIGKLTDNVNKGFYTMNNSMNTGFSTLNNSMNTGFSTLNNSINTGFSTMNNSINTGFSKMNDVIKDLNDNITNQFVKLNGTLNENFGKLKDLLNVMNEEQKQQFLIQMEQAKLDKKELAHLIEAEGKKHKKAIDDLQDETRKRFDVIDENMDEINKKLDELMNKINDLDFNNVDDITNIVNDPTFLAARCSGQYRWILCSEVPGKERRWMCAAKVHEINQTNMVEFLTQQKNGNSPTIDRYQKDCRSERCEPCN